MITPTLSPTHSEKGSRLLCEIFKKNESEMFETTGWKVFVSEYCLDKIPVVMKNDGIQIGYKINFDNRNYLDQFDTWDSILDSVSVHNGTTSAWENSKLPEAFDTFGLLEMLAERTDGVYLLHFGKVLPHILNRLHIDELQVFNNVVGQEIKHWITDEGIRFSDNKGSVKLAPFTRALQIEDRVSIYTSEKFRGGERNFSNFTESHSASIFPQGSNSGFDRVHASLARVSEYVAKDNSFRFIFIGDSPYITLKRLKEDIKRSLESLDNITIRSELERVTHRFYWENPSSTDEIGIINGLLKIRREIEGIADNLRRLRSVK